MNEHEHARKYSLKLFTEDDVIVVKHLVPIIEVQEYDHLAINMINKINASVGQCSFAVWLLTPRVFGSVVTLQEPWRCPHRGGISNVATVHLTRGQSDCWKFI